MPSSVFLNLPWRQQVTSAQAPGGAFVQGILQPAPPPPLAPGQRPPNALVHPWRMPLYTESQAPPTPGFPCLDTVANGFPVHSDSRRNYSQEKKEFSPQHFYPGRQVCD
jgi:hypothetical protein